MQVKPHPSHESHPAPGADGSIGERYRTHLLTVVVIVSNVAGNILMSRGLHHVATLRGFDVGAYLEAVLNPYVLTGVVILTFWMVCNLALLSRADLSYVLPVTASAYVLIAIAGRFVLGENISLARWVGIVAITMGVALVGETAPLTTKVREFDPNE